MCEDGRTVRARGVVLATGGAAALWSRTTNPPGSLGIGLLLAREAGAALADLEFTQFHPTAVTGITGREGFLVTEAIRGEGARLLDASGERFVDELAPRDEVARAIWDRMAESGRASVDLDMRDVDPMLFPNVVGALQEAGLDPDPRPRAGRARGALRDGRDRLGPRRRDDPPGPLRRGRVGVHRAARGQPARVELAERVLRLRRPRRSRRADRAERRRPASRRSPRPLPVPSRASREALWRDAGLIRTREGLERLVDDPYPLVGLIAAHALLRTETRGAHMRADFPRTDAALDLQHSVSRAPGAAPVYERWT